MLIKKENGLYYRRPLFLILTFTLATFALSLCLSGKEKIFGALILSALSLFSLVFLFVPSIKKASLLLLTFTLLFASFPLYFSYFQIDRRAESLVSQKTETVTVRAKEVLAESSYGATYRVRLLSVGEQSTNADALMFIDSANRPKENEKIKVKATITALKSESFGAYYMADGVLVKVNSEEFLSFEDGENDYLFKEESPVSSTLSTLYQEHLGEEEGALTSALFLGNKSALHESTALGFRRLGISHLAAVSGLHISILIYGIERLLRILTVHKHIRSAISVFLMISYLSIIGFPISAVRASLMYSVVLFSYYLGGRYDSVTALSFVAVLLCFLSPYTVYDAAFWLSVMATAGVLAVVSKNEPINPNTPRVPKVPIVSFKTFFFRVFKPLLQSVKTSFLITFGAICATFPITAFLFDEISVFSALATLLLSPIVTVLLYGALLLPFLRFIPFVPLLLKAIAGFALDIIHYFSSFDFALISLNDSILRNSLLLFAFIFILMKIFPFEKKFFRRLIKSAVAFAFILIVTLTLIIPARERTLVYERQASKESLFLRNRGEYSLFLFDTIDTSRTVAQLHAHGCTYLHNLCLTGYIETLYIRLDEFVSTIKTEEVLLPAPTTRVEEIVAERIGETLQEHGTRLSFFSKNKEFALDEKVIWTDLDYEDNRQTYSLEVHGTKTIYTVPRKIDVPYASETLALYREADVLILGKRWVENGNYITMQTDLPSLEVLINANSYGGIRVPESKEHHFDYYNAPTSVSHRIP